MMFFYHSPATATLKSISHTVYMTSPGAALKKIDTCLQSTLFSVSLGSLTN